MGYFQVRNDSRVVNYDRRGLIRLATGLPPPVANLINDLRSNFTTLELRRVPVLSRKLRL